MENLIALAIVAVVVIQLATRSRKRPGRSRRRHADTPHRAAVPTSEPPPFDARTATPPAAPQTLRGTAYVVDGDTLTIQKIQVRLFGIDAPELDHPYGRRAKTALGSLCKGQSIRAEVMANDVHGRTVAQCFLPDGRDLSAEMVRCGLALDWQKYSGGRYRLLETPDARRKLWLADARQKGRMEVWERFEAKRAAAATKD